MNMINLNDMPPDIMHLIFSFNREEAVIKKELKLNKIKFISVLNDIKYVNYYYNDPELNKYNSCKNNFNDKETDVLNYIDMIHHLREGTDMLDDPDFNIEEHKADYDDAERHDEMMHDLNDDY